MTDKKRLTASERLKKRLYDGNPRRERQLERARLNLRIANKVHDLRIAAGLTQEQLANRVGTTRTVITRVEDDNYDGQSLRLLNRIADALGYELEVEFRVPCEGIRLETLAAVPGVRLIAYNPYARSETTHARMTGAGVVLGPLDCVAWGGQEPRDPTVDRGTRWSASDARDKIAFAEAH
jgi:transcriptional regulator with XRE-family HTH domain